MLISDIIKATSDFLRAIYILGSLSYKARRTKFEKERNRYYV